MSAEWQTQTAESWKVTLPCTRAESEKLTASEPDFGIEPPPVLMTSEPDPARPEHWQLDVYLGAEPDADLLESLRQLVPSAAAVAPIVERIDDADWVTISQGFLEPIQAGRFYVHTAAHADRIPAGAVAFRIEAGRAFGTGHHETTAGCLQALDELAKAGRNFGRIVDVGTGSGLLAFAARALWPQAQITASDIDPVSIDVTAENMAINAIPVDAIALIAADGLDDPALQARAPFDLIIANILAGPLIALASDLIATLDQNGTIILAGLLASQSEDVLAAYTSRGMVPSARIDSGDWSILTLVQAS
ncbi:50S ribosomal protein L11 methyltransferase [Sphingomonas crusticola]|uniref:50S ribosomal protein L11 methyltransferase n=1 Tax=Sphingomonas crusticola TaxID=1697973 RepID=UPI000E23D5EE|nr:50S ribosomal protein L11 methyltransferase [Sphingomonas crusticola]